ncbi:MAG TPA: type II toxin-antitoxin system VapC family toxin [Gammaproteobacteria bacterium]|nr:type II toxin-antitoxin system VapC family toxin [Gammaproteobacteria bacterium]
MTERVLDASALLALLQDEPGAARVAAVLPDAAIGSVNLAEVVGKLVDKGMPPALVKETLRTLDLDVREFSENLAYAAGELRTSTARLGLSLGDRACLALTQHLGMPVLTADASWQQFKIENVEVEMIR